jgi:hypothetical protein
MVDFDSLPNENEIPEEEKKIKPKYISKDGFVNMKPLRGIYGATLIMSRIGDRNAVICGGYVRWMCSANEKIVEPSDIDIYSADEKTFEDMKIVFNDLEIKFENNICISYKPAKEFQGYPPIQLIKPIKEGAIVAVGTMEEILNNFDFTVVRAGLLWKSEGMPISETRVLWAMVDADFEHDEKEKTLRIKNIHCPISSMYRCVKYMKKGYWLPTGQALMLFIDWQERDEEYRMKIIEYMQKAQTEGLTQTQIDDLEALMRID